MTALSDFLLSSIFFRFPLYILFLTAQLSIFVAPIFLIAGISFLIAHATKKCTDDDELCNRGKERDRRIGTLDAIIGGIALGLLLFLYLLLLLVGDVNFFLDKLLTKMNQEIWGTRSFFRYS
jgi:hypothetical protein